MAEFFVLHGDAESKYGDFRDLSHIWRFEAGLIRPLVLPRHGTWSQTSMLGLPFALFINIQVA